MTEAELTELASRAVLRLGASAGDAADVARILVMGDLFGHHTHGVSRLESYGARALSGALDARATVRVERLSPAVARVDGANAFGPVVGMRALEAAMEGARACGIGAAFARNSNHFGAVGPYCQLAADAGFASIIGSNSSTTIAPTGGSEARVGNSPLGIGVPHPGAPPVILDMAMSVVARGKIREALKRGKAIPETWATDRDGRPTADPKAALDGFLLPIGGYKGYGLALAVDLFAGLLSGGAFLDQVNSWVDSPDAPGNLGHFFILLDARVLGSPGWLAGRMTEFARILHATPASDPAHPVLLPGEIERGNLERQRREGLAMDPEVLAKLKAMAGTGVG